MKAKGLQQQRRQWLVSDIYFCASLSLCIFVCLTILADVVSGSVDNMTESVRNNQCFLVSVENGAQEEKGRQIFFLRIIQICHDNWRASCQYLWERIVRFSRLLKVKKAINISYIVCEDNFLASFTFDLWHHPRTSPQSTLARSMLAFRNLLLCSLN